MKNLRIIAGVIIALVLALACEDSGDEAKTVAFTEYSLSETSCKWVELSHSHDFEDNELIVIDSDEQLDGYILCVRRGKAVPM